MPATDTYEQILARLTRMTRMTAPAAPTRRFVYQSSGYDAVSSVGKRKPPSARVLSEDQELRQIQRRMMTTSTRDLQRNFAIAAWAIRKHLDFLTSFTFDSKTGNKTLDQTIEDFVTWWSKPANFDSAGRHGLRRFLRLIEARRTLDGDVLANRLRNGKIQGIEGDRVQDMAGVPYADLGIDPINVINGVETDSFGRARTYLVFKRRKHGIGLEWDRAVPAVFAELVGYFDRYDQVRGISLLAPGINTLRDVYENFDYALAKSKVSQLFALATFRENSDDLGQQETTPDDDDDGPPSPRYDIDFGRGPFHLDLDAGDKAAILTDENPSDQFQAFTQSMIMVAIKALDLPYSFYDESHTNWVGQRQANAQYMLSASTKRQDLKELLDTWTQWRLSLAVMDGQLTLPRKMTVDDLKWDWIPTGVPPVDPVKEVTADIAEINAGLASLQSKCRERGDDWRQILDEKKEANDYAAELGIVLSTALPSPKLEDPNNPAAQSEDQNLEADPDGESESGAKPTGKQKAKK